MKEERKWLGVAGYCFKMGMLPSRFVTYGDFFYDNWLLLGQQELAWFHISLFIRGCVKVQSCRPGYMDVEVKDQDFP